MLKMCARMPTLSAAANAEASKTPVASPPDLRVCQDCAAHYTWGGPCETADRSPACGNYHTPPTLDGQFDPVTGDLAAARGPRPNPHRSHMPRCLARPPAPAPGRRPSETPIAVIRRACGWSDPRSRPPAAPTATPPNAECPAAPIKNLSGADTSPAGMVSDPSKCGDAAASTPPMSAPGPDGGPEIPSDRDARGVGDESGRAKP